MRSYNSLRREGVHTVGALASRSEKDLLAIDGLGPQSVSEIKQSWLTMDSGWATPLSQPSRGRWQRRWPAAAAATGGTAEGLNGALPPPAARPPDEDAIDLLSVAGLPVLKRILPGVGILVAALLVLVLRARLRRRRAAASRRARCPPAARARGTRATGAGRAGPG